VSADRLGQVHLPAVAHLSGGHHVVLHEKGETGGVIADPASRIVTRTIAFPAHSYTRSLLLFDWPPAPSAIATAAATHEQRQRHPEAHPGVPWGFGLSASV